MANSSPEFYQLTFTGLEIISARKSFCPDSDNVSGGRKTLKLTICPSLMSVMILVTDSHFRMSYNKE